MKIVYTKGISFELGGIVITTGDAVRKRIIDSCQSNNITINKLATISGVTQSTVNNIVSKRNNSATVATVKSSVTDSELPFQNFLIQNILTTLNRK